VSRGLEHTTKSHHETSHSCPSEVITSELHVFVSLDYLQSISHHLCRRLSSIIITFSRPHSPLSHTTFSYQYICGFTYTLEPTTHQRKYHHLDVPIPTFIQSSSTASPPARISCLRRGVVSLSNRTISHSRRGGSFPRRVIKLNSTSPKNLIRYFIYDTRKITQPSAALSCTTQSPTPQADSNNKHYTSTLHTRLHLSVPYKAASPEAYLSPIATKSGTSNPSTASAFVDREALICAKRVLVALLHLA
jgi:hypothetical protein